MTDSIRSSGRQPAAYFSRLKCIVNDVNTDIATRIHRFRNRRRSARIALIAGILTIVAGQLLHEKFTGVAKGNLRTISILAGLALFLVMFVVHITRKCPAYGKQFSKHRLYQDSESAGLPLFNRSPSCPFCGETIDGDR